MSREIENVPKSYRHLIARIGEILEQARQQTLRQISKAQVVAYWAIGREIVEFDQQGESRAKYGEQLIVKLAQDMTEKFGRGFSARNLRNMRAFYLSFQIRQTVSAKSQPARPSADRADPKEIDVKPAAINRQLQFEPELSWSNYCELLKVEEPLARSFYEREAVNNNWSVRELKRQINAMLFERLALSKDAGKVNKLALPSEEELTAKLKSLPLWDKAKTRKKHNR